MASGLGTTLSQRYGVLACPRFLLTAPGAPGAAQKCYSRVRDFYGVATFLVVNGAGRV